MKKNMKVILIICFSVLILCISGVIILKMNNFNFKTFKFNKTTTTTTTKKIVDSNTSDNSEEDNTDMSDIELPELDDIGDTDNNDSSNSKTTTTKNSSNSSSNKTTKPSSGGNSSSSKTSVGDVSTSKFESDINSVKLSPVVTRYPELDNMVSKIISNNTNSSMTNNQKVYAVFKYLMDNATYNMNATYLEQVYNIIDKYHYDPDESFIVHRAYRMLKDKYGVCDHYAAALAVILRRMGFEAYVANGYVKKSGGGTTGHAWVILKANGNWYNLDAQIADKNYEKGKNDQIKYYYGKTDSEVNLYTYDRNANIARYKGFKEAAPLKMKLTMTGGINETKTVTSYRSVTEKGDYIAYVGSKADFKIELSGASKYNYSLRSTTTSMVGDKPNSVYKNIYSTNGDLVTKSTVTFSETFTTPGASHYYQLSVWNGDSGTMAEYYFYVSVRPDDRLKDLAFNYNKTTNNLTGKTYFVFSSNVTKYNSSSTCTPRYEYQLLSTNDPSERHIYTSSDDGSMRLDYTEGYTYKIKVTARCGSYGEKIEREYTIS